jgi:hypothetical protein
MLLLLISVNTLSKAKIGQEYETENPESSPQKEANLISKKYITQETAAQNTNSQLKSSFENMKIVQEEPKARTIL